MSERYIYQDLPGPEDFKDWRAYAEALRQSLAENLQELHRLSEINDRPVPNKYTVSNPTALRTIDVAAGTLGDVRQVLGTLLSDLTRSGRLTNKGPT